MKISGRRRRGVVGTLIGAGLMALVWSSATAQVFNPTVFTLDNGLEVVVVENNRAPVVTHMIWYKVGAADELPGKSGVAHFFEHLMFKGTPKYPDGEFSRLVALNGGRENAFTSQDYTGYFQNIAADRLALVMEMEADRMTNLVLTKEVIEPERLVILEERRQRVDSTPSGLLSEQVAAATYSNHPYRLPVIGWEHEIRGLSVDDLLTFYRTWYAPNNAVLVVSGDVDPEEVRALAEKTYGLIPAQDVPERIRPSEPPHVAPREVVMRDARVGQPNWSRRYLAPSYTWGDTKQAYPLQVLAEIIGSGATGTLYRSLVIDQELAVSAGAFYSPGSMDISTFGLWLSPRQGVPIDDVVVAMEAELVKLIAGGVDESDVARAKQRLIDGAVFALDSLQGPARTLGAAVATGRSVADVEAWPTKIGAVTTEQVNEAARAVLKLSNSTTGMLLPEQG